MNSKEALDRIKSNAIESGNSIVKAYGIEARDIIKTITVDGVTKIIYPEEELNIIEKDLELLEKYKLIDSILEGASMTRCTLPNGKVVATDIGYVYDFWDEFKIWLESTEEN